MMEKVNFKLAGFKRHRVLDVCFEVTAPPEADKESMRRRLPAAYLALRDAEERLQEIFQDCTVLQSVNEETPVRGTVEGAIDAIAHGLNLPGITVIEEAET